MISLKSLGAINGKQDTLIFDEVPTEGSSNPVTSRGVYNAIYGEVAKLGILTVDPKIISLDVDFSELISLDTTLGFNSYSTSSTSYSYYTIPPAMVGTVSNVSESVTVDSKTLLYDAKNKQLLNINSKEGSVKVLSQKVMSASGVLKYRHPVSSTADYKSALQSALESAYLGVKIVDSDDWNDISGTLTGIGIPVGDSVANYTMGWVNPPSITMDISSGVISSISITISGCYSCSANTGLKFPSVPHSIAVTGTYINISTMTLTPKSSHVLIN